MGDQTSVVEYSLSLAGNDNEKPMKPPSDASNEESTQDENDD